MSRHAGGRGLRGRPCCPTPHGTPPPGASSAQGLPHAGRSGGSWRNPRAPRKKGQQRAPLRRDRHCEPPPHGSAASSRFLFVKRRGRQCPLERERWDNCGAKCVKPRQNRSEHEFLVNVPGTEPRRQRLRNGHTCLREGGSGGEGPRRGTGRRRPRPPNTWQKSARGPADQPQVYEPGGKRKAFFSLKEDFLFSQCEINYSTNFRNVYLQRERHPTQRQVCSAPFS